MTDQANPFAGGTAVITGAGSGIGAGLARRAGELGMNVVVTDINGPAAEAVAAQINAAGAKAEALVVDVSQPDELDRLAETVFDRHGSVRLLVNNAGIETLGFSWEIPVARWEATLNINLHGVVHGVRAFVPRMLASGEECWVANLSSVGGFGQMPTQAAYIVTKHAVQSLSECLYLEMQVKKAPINVCSIIPGMLKTGIFNADQGKGEPDNAAAYRKAMHDMMAAYGMDLAEGCRIIMDKMAAREFWVDTQPDMTDQILGGRIGFFQSRQAPVLADQVKQLLGMEA